MSLAPLRPPAPAGANPGPERRGPAPGHALPESHLTESELRVALEVLHAISDACGGSAEFARRVVEALPRLVGSDLTTLSVYDLDRGHRSVVSDAPGAISPREIDVFDRHFFAHPLVREHGRNPAAVFSDHERELLELVRPHLANLYRLGVAIDRSRAAPADAAAEVAEVPLTPREREVLDWVAAGKTNRDIATILGASPRTVEKHLERIYEKLGVETRTAAVMRVIKRVRRN